MVDRVALEMRSTRKGTGGSNPSLSAMFFNKSLFFRLIVRHMVLHPTIYPTFQLG